MFVNGAPVPITEGVNTIFVRPKMDFGTKTAVMDALQDLGVKDGRTPDVSLHYGAYQRALLVHNIVNWTGPAFQGVPCTADMIGRLDPDEPLVGLVLEEIARRNPFGGAKADAAEKKDVTSAGELPSPASA